MVVRYSNMVERKCRQSPFRPTSLKTFGSNSSESLRRTNDFPTVVQDAFISKKSTHFILSICGRGKQKLTFVLTEFDRTM